MLSDYSSNIKSFFIKRYSVAFIFYYQSHKKCGKPECQSMHFYLKMTNTSLSHNKLHQCCPYSHILFNFLITDYFILFLFEFTSIILPKKILANTRERLNGLIQFLAYGTPQKHSVPLALLPILERSTCRCRAEPVIQG